MAKGDLISRKMLLKELRQEQRECEKDGEEFGGESILFAEAFGDVIDMVKRLPAVDAAPVVRCRECKHCAVCGNGLHVCKAYDQHLLRTTPDGYCHMGAKMDGGGVTDDV